MANHDNSCSDLEIKPIYQELDSESCALNSLFMLQKDIQENVYGYDFNQLRELPLQNMREFFQWNTHAQIDEAHEAMDALGGIHDGIGSAVWKPWKKAHQMTLVSNSHPISFNHLSERDIKELKMELIDELHFLFNKMHAAGMTTDELFNYYFSKNEENRERVKNGY